MDRTRKAWMNGLFFVVTLAVNALGAIGVINGLSQKQISDMYLTLITPSPATFSIWSIIYLLLLVSVVVMIVRKNDTYYDRAVDQITSLFRISCVLNIAWIVSFSYVLVELSLLFILGFVVTLALICQKLLRIQDKKRWLLPLTFGLYTGWLVIATVVNTAAALVKLKWNGFGLANDVWGIITLLIAVFLVIFILSKNRNAAFPLPVAWGYWGIYQFLKAPEGFKGEFGLLQIVALAGMVVLIVAAVVQFYRNRFSLLPVLDRP
jgi:benzodiazapine receptor